MTANERISLINVKIERADKHIVDLQTDVSAFLATDPHGVIEDVDAQTGKKFYKMSSVGTTPPRIVSIAADAIQNLSAALDHLMMQLLLVQLGLLQTDEYIMFPFGDTAKKYKRALSGKAEGRLRQDAIDALYATEAYEGGRGHALWALNRLNNIDKHRSILTAATSAIGANIGGVLARQTLKAAEASGIFGSDFRAQDFPELNVFLDFKETICPLKVGDVLVTGLPADHEPYKQKDFRFGVALDEPKITECEPLIETIKGFADAVRGTIEAFRPCLA